MKNIILGLTFLLSLSGYSQNTITGVVKNTNGDPIDLATVYINGSTKGTYTNRDGKFVLENRSIPAQLIVSHIGYKTHTLNIEQPGAVSVAIQLNEDNVLLEEIVATGVRSDRNENLTLFKKHFLGTDKYGKSAIIKNDSVLVFSMQKQKEKTGYKEQEKTVFTATTTSPLIIEMPLLGYIVNVELVDFSVTETKGNYTGISHLGYFYFKQMEITDNKKKTNIEKERKKVYYNSGQHFCRSLYDDALLQNGYLLIKESYNKSTGKSDPDIPDFLSIKNESGQLLIEGLKDKIFSIFYYPGKNRNPRNLKEEINTKDNSKKLAKTLRNYVKKANSSLSSSIRFAADTCRINSGGTIPDNNIIFGGYISNNKTGGLLPDDYEPEE